MNFLRFIYFSIRFNIIDVVLVAIVAVAIAVLSHSYSTMVQSVDVCVLCLNPTKIAIIHHLNLKEQIFRLIRLLYPAELRAGERRRTMTILSY